MKSRTPIPESGELELAGLEPGNHFFHLLDSHDSKMLSEIVELSTDAIRLSRPGSRDPLLARGISLVLER